MNTRTREAVAAILRGHGIDPKHVLQEGASINVLGPLPGAQLTVSVFLQLTPDELGLVLEASQTQTPEVDR